MAKYFGVRHIRVGLDVQNITFYKDLSSGFRRRLRARQIGSSHAYYSRAHFRGGALVEKSFEKEKKNNIVVSAVSYRVLTYAVHIQCEQTVENYTYIYIIRFTEFYWKNIIDTRSVYVFYSIQFVTEI